MKGGTERQQEEWSQELPFEWLRIGLDLLADKRIDESNYRNTIVRDRMLQSVALTYWEALIEHARARGLTVEDIGRRLGVHRATYNRWINDEHVPHPDKFFGTIVVVLRQELHDVGFPKNREVISRAVRRTLALIREKECDGSRRTPTREELACVSRLVSDPRSHQLLPGGRRPDPTIVADIFSGVRRELSGQFPDVKAISDERFTRLLIEWTRPYVLFKIGLLGGWEFVNEDAI